MDDRKENLVALRQVLYGIEAEIIEAMSGNEALAATLDHDFAMAILDVMMPGMSGLELAEHLRRDEKTRLVPIIFVTANYPDEQHLFSGYEAGCVDYLIKPYAPEVILAKVRIFLEMDQQKRALQKHQDELETLVAERTAKLENELAERKRTEKALQESEQRYHNLADSGQALIWTSGQDKKCDYFNVPWLAFTGRSLAQELGDGWLEGVHPDDFESCLQIYVAAFDQRERFSMEYRLRHVSGEYRWIQDEGTPRFDNKGVFLGYIGHCLDITERKRAAEDQEKLQMQFTQAQKLESVARLAGGVAHDFNNMLGVILGYAEIALGKIGPSDPLHHDLQAIYDAGKRSSNITRQLLAFARKQTVVPQILDLNETVGGILKMLRRLIGEDVDLAWLPGKSIYPVKVDPSQMDQLLANLCVNSRDAIAGVGKISIETDAVTFDEAYCSDHAGFIPGEFIRLVVSDDGCGMGQETLDKIFEPFFTTKEEGQGTGLGLATVYGIVKQNNGFINVYSEPDQGTTFAIYLPRYQDSAGEKRATASPDISLGHGEIILVVEDEITILKLSKTMLEKLGYSVLTASTPSEALRLVEMHSGRIQLLLTDVIMPEMNGRDLAARLHACFPDIKTLFMSGYTADVISHRGVLDESVCFMHKPFSTKDLATKVREALEQD
ncbi:MAG: response regulator [Desulfobulbus sp.]|nr:response regulator [Desulfobulbus sp.]